jgi:hypothetical protein
MMGGLAGDSGALCKLDSSRPEVFPALATEEHERQREYGRVFHLAGPGEARRRCPGRRTLARLAGGLRQLLGGFGAVYDPKVVGNRLR